MDGSNNIYIADSGSNAVRVVWAGNGTIATVAGNGTAGACPLASGATTVPARRGGCLNYPTGVALTNHTGQSQVYIADALNNRVVLLWNDTLRLVAGELIVSSPPVTLATLAVLFPDAMQETGRMASTATAASR